MNILTPEYLVNTTFTRTGHNTTGEVVFYKDSEGNVLTVVDPDEGPAGHLFILNEDSSTEEQMYFSAVGNTEQVIAIAVKFF